MKKRKKKTCGSKIRHESKDAAFGELRSLLKRNFIFHKIKVYECQYCGKWHVGRTNEILYDKFDQLTPEKYP